MLLLIYKFLFNKTSTPMEYPIITYHFYRLTANLFCGKSKAKRNT